jgi:hypothetical protein
MVRRADAQRSVFEVLLPDGDKRWTKEFRAIDEILDDEARVDGRCGAARYDVRERVQPESGGDFFALARRHPEAGRLDLAGQKRSARSRTAAI